MGQIVLTILAVAAALCGAVALAFRRPRACRGCPLAGKGCRPSHTARPTSCPAAGPSSETVTGPAGSGSNETATPSSATSPVKAWISLVLLTQALTLPAVSAQTALEPNPTPADSAGLIHKPVATEAIPSGRPKIGLVLSGGGAKGAAHIGVIRYLEEIGLPIDYVTGTSIGAIVGSFYCMGYSADEIEDIVCSLDWDLYMSERISSRSLSFQRQQALGRYALNIPFNTGRQAEGSVFLESLPGGLYPGNNVENLLRALSVGYQDSLDFDRLPIPFACVAVDMLNLEPVVFRSGSLPLAVRASMSMPYYYDPVAYNGKIMIDGGMLDNLPVSVCRDMGADIIITSKVSGGGDNTRPEELRSLVGMAWQLLCLPGAETHRKNLAGSDILLAPDLDGASTFSFESKRMLDLIENGYRCAAQQADALLSLTTRLNEATGEAASTGQIDTEPVSAETVPAEETCKKATASPKARRLDQMHLELESVELSGIDPAEARYLLGKTGLKRHRSLSGTELTDRLQILYGTGLFEKADFSLMEDSATERYRVKADLRYREPHTIGLSLRADNLEALSLLVRAGFFVHRLNGFKADITAKISYNPYLDLHLAYSHVNAPQINLSALLKKTENTLGEKGHSWGTSRLLYLRSQLYLSELCTRHWSAQGGLFFEQYLYARQLDKNHAVSLETFQPISPFAGVFASFQLDFRNDAVLPSRGSFLSLSGAWRCVDLKQNAGFEGFYDVRFHYKGYFPIGSRVVLSPQLHARSLLGSGYDRGVAGLVSPYLNYMGGLMEGRYTDGQLPFIGVTRPEIMYPHLVVAMGEGRVKLSGAHYLSLVGSVARESHTLPSMFRPAEATGETVYGRDQTAYIYWGAGLRYTLRLPIGPLICDLAWSNLTRRPGVYLSLGYDF